MILPGWRNRGLYSTTTPCPSDCSNLTPLSFVAAYNGSRGTRNKTVPSTENCWPYNNRVCFNQWITNNKKPNANYLDIRQKSLLRACFLCQRFRQRNKLAGYVLKHKPLSGSRQKPLTTNYTGTPKLLFKTRIKIVRNFLIVNGYLILK